MLHFCNPYVRSFRSTAALNTPGVLDIRIVIGAAGFPDRWRYNVPNVPEVAAFLPDGIEPEVNNRDITAYLRRGGIRHLKELNPAYDPLHFVLLFARGTSG